MRWIVLAALDVIAVWSRLRIAGEQDAAAKEAPAFCHAFDLTKRLTHPSITNMSFIPAHVRVGKRWAGKLWG
jgi:hypothetical protein